MQYWLHANGRVGDRGICHLTPPGLNLPLCTIVLNFVKLGLNPLTTYVAFLSKYPRSRMGPELPGRDCSLSHRLSIARADAKPHPETGKRLAVIPHQI